MKYISATKILNLFKPRVDFDAVAEKCAAREGVSVAEIKAGWEAKRDRGIVAHALFQSILAARLKGVSVVDHPRALEAWNSAPVEWKKPVSDAAIYLADNIKGDFDSVQAESEHRLNFTKDNEYKFNGSIDVLFTVGHDDGTTGGIVADLKFQDLSDRSFGNFLAPFDDIPSSKKTDALLQAAIYATILRRFENKKFDLLTAMILSVDIDGDHKTNLVEADPEHYEIAGRMIDEAVKPPPKHKDEMPF